jgi:hypothetical protein
MQAQPDLGHRKISLPSLKMTQSASTKPVKASLKGSWTSSDGLPLLSPNALNRESLDVTILSPMIIVKPSKPLPIQRLLHHLRKKAKERAPSNLAERCLTKLISEKTQTERRATPT